MTPPLRMRLNGFTLLELGLVLIVMGILAAAAMPMVTSAHRNHMREQDRQILETAKLAIIGAAYRIGTASPSTLPCFNNLNAAGETACDPEATFFTRLGVRWQDSQNNPLQYHPAPTLTDIGGTSICAATSPVTAEPKVCPYSSALGVDACAAPYDPAGGPNIAFVLVALGEDRTANLNNLTGATRAYENPRQPPNLQLDSAAYYDDLVVSMSVAELRGHVCK